MKKERYSEKPGKGKLRRIKEIRTKITEIDLVCSGTLLSRKKTCGKPNCRCAKDPDARHGPYHEWTRPEKGRLVHKTVSKEQAVALEEAIRNYRKLKELLSLWKNETIAIILGPEKHKS